MIYITSDIHHQSLGTENQKYSDRSEMDCAKDFLDLLNKYGLKATYFISGLSFKEDWGSSLEEIAFSNKIELGGHNWDCFKNSFYHRLCNKALNSYNGHKAFQRKDCERTKEIILKMTGRDVSIWRNHMYMHGVNTDEILSSCGINICSDGVIKGNLVPDKRLGNYINLPINILPDHEHIYHAERTVESVRKWVDRYSWRDAFGSESYYINEWASIVSEQVKEKENNGEDSLLIIHPITMYLSDKYKAVDSLLSELSEYKTAFLGDYND
jgi:hypothetical protein